MRGSENRVEWGCKFVHKLWAILEVRSQPLRIANSRVF